MKNENELEKFKGIVDIIERTIDGDDEAMLANDYGGTGWEQTPAVQKVYRLLKEIRELKNINVNLSPIDDNADLMLADEWLRCAESGGFIPYDGDGYWATKNGMDENSSVWNLRKPKWATHVVWFNR